MTTTSSTWQTLTGDYTAPDDGFVRMVLTSTRLSSATAGGSRFTELKASFPSAEVGYTAGAGLQYSGMYPVFRGYVDTWEVASDGFTGEATVRAVDWLGVASRPIGTYTRERMQLAYEQARSTGTLGDFYYWTLDQDSTDTQAIPLIGGYPMTIKPYAAFPPATAGFTDTKVIPYQDGTSGSFAIDDDNWAKGAALSLVDNGNPVVPGAVRPIGTSGTIFAAGDFGVSFWMIPELPTAGRSCLFLMANANGATIAAVYMDSAGKLSAEWQGNIDFPSTTTLTTSWAVEAGKPVFITFKVWNDDASTIGYTAVELRKNNAQAVKAYSYNNERYSAAYITFGGREFGGTHADYFHGNLAHVMYATNDMLPLMNDALWGATNTITTLTESSALSQILDFADFILYRRLDAGLSTVLSPRWETDTEVSGLLADTASDGDGTFFIGPDGSATLHNRGRRLAPGPRWTISEWAGSPRYTLDAQYVLNSVTAAQDGGIARTLKDDASVRQYGLRDKQVRRNVASADELLSAAGWILHKYTESIPRVDNLEIDASALEAGGNTDATLIGFAHGADISDRVLLTGLPVSAPADELAYFVEGVNTSVAVDGSKHTYRVTFYVSDAARSSGFILEDADYGVLDADGAVLTY
ncbi:hypothetical protein ACQPZJ_35455 [Actinoplanes sp. CA-054009]